MGSLGEKAVPFLTLEGAPYCFPQRLLRGCEKEGNRTFSDSMDGPGEYYAK